MTRGDAGDPQQVAPSDRRRPAAKRAAPVAGDPRVDDPGSRGVQRPNGSSARVKPRRAGATPIVDPLSRLNGSDDASARPAALATDAMPTIVPADAGVRTTAIGAGPDAPTAPVAVPASAHPLPTASAPAPAPERPTTVPTPPPRTVPDATVVVPVAPPPAPPPEPAVDTTSVPLIDVELDDERRGVVLRRRPRPRVRRVTRIVRHIDTWSVFKVALVFNAVLYLTCLTAGVLLWNVAYTTGTVDNVETFFEQFGWESFEFNGGEIYHNAWIAGLFVAVGLTGLAVLLATLFNLITDLVGGVRVSVLEEEVVARQITREQVTAARTRHREARRSSPDGGPPTEPIELERRA